MIPVNISYVQWPIQIHLCAHRKLRDLLVLKIYQSQYCHKEAQQRDAEDHLDVNTRDVLSNRVLRVPGRMNRER